MPRSAPTPCVEHGCPAMAAAGMRGRCEKHGPEALRREALRRRRGRRAPRRRGLNAEERKLESFYGSKAWRQTRNSYFAKNPLCVHCKEAGVLKAGDVVDHIHERRDGGHNHATSNLQTLCHKHHAIKTKLEKHKRDVNDREW